MDYVLLILRLLHVLGGIFWVGGALVMAFFITPTIMATAEAGQKFMERLLTQTKFSRAMTIAALSTIIAGFILYWIDSAGFTSDWMMAGPGIGFGIGAFFALIGFGAGMMIPRGGAAMVIMLLNFVCVSKCPMNFCPASAVDMMVGVMKNAITSAPPTQKMPPNMCNKRSASKTKFISFSLTIRFDLIQYRKIYLAVLQTN